MINLPSFQASQPDVGGGVELEIHRLHLMRVLGLVTTQRAVFGPFPLMRSRSRTPLYRGIKKNDQKLKILFALANLYKVRFRSAAARPPSSPAASGGAAHGRGTVDAGGLSTQHAAGQGMPRGLGL